MVKHLQQFLGFLSLTLDKAHNRLSAVDSVTFKWLLQELCQWVWFWSGFKHPIITYVHLNVLLSVTHGCLLTCLVQILFQNIISQGCVRSSGKAIPPPSWITGSKTSANSLPCLACKWGWELNNTVQAFLIAGLRTALLLPVWTRLEVAVLRILLMGLRIIPSPRSDWP